jgi:hypothetical protein
MLHGGALANRVFLTDVVENMSFMAAVARPAEIGRAELYGRPYVEVALYWSHPRWERIATDPSLLRTLSPVLGEPARIYLLDDRQHLVFDYHGGSPAALFDNRSLKAMDSAAILILARHGIVE